MKVIVHFGMHKTGTSSIQASLHASLPDPNFYYLSMGQSNQSEQILTLFLEKPQDYRPYKIKGASLSEIAQKQKLYRDRLIGELKKARGKTAILSGEGISNLSSTELVSLKTFFGAFDSCVDAVGYVRPAKGYIESSFQQLVKGGHSSFDLTKYLPIYRDKFERFDTVFGRSNVSFWLFQPAVFPHGDVVLDFAQKIGMQYLPELSIHENDSLSLPALRLLYCYRKHGPDYGVGKNVIKENRNLIEAISMLNGAKLRFHSEIVKPLLQARSRDILWMEERLGASLMENLSRDDDIAIREESDLLRVEDYETQWLASKLGPEFENRWHKDISPHDVAEWMHALRRKLRGDENFTDELSRRPRNIPEPKSAPKSSGTSRTLFPHELASSAGKLHPGTSLDLEVTKGKRLILAALNVVSDNLSVSPGTAVTVGGLGDFSRSGFQPDGTRRFRPSKQTRPEFKGQNLEIAALSASADEHT